MTPVAETVRHKACKIVLSVGGACKGMIDRINRSHWIWIQDTFSLLSDENLPVFRGTGDSRLCLSGMHF